MTVTGISQLISQSADPAQIHAPQTLQHARARVQCMLGNTCCTYVRERVLMIDGEISG